MSSDANKAALSTIDRLLAAPSEETALLTRLRDAIPDINDPEFTALAHEQAVRVAEGRAPDALAVRELDAMIKQRAAAAESTTRPGVTPEELQRTSAQPQMALPGVEAPATVTQRATVANFQKMLDAKDVQGMRAAIEKTRTDAIAAAQALARNTPEALRKARLANALAKRNEALAEAQRTASEAATARVEARTILVEAKAAVTTAEQQVDTLQRALQDIADLKVVLAKEPTEMRTLIAAPKMLSQEAPLRKRLKQAQTLLGAANALLSTVTSAPANPKIAASTAAETALTKSEKELAEATKETRAAEPAVEPALSEKDEYRAAIQRGREGLDLPGIRRLVDTTKMNTQIANIRSAMGSLDAQIESATDPVKKAELQAKRDQTAQKLETVYADAPRITSAIKVKDQEMFEKAFDDAQVAAYDKRSAKSRIRGGEYGPALTSRQQGAVARKGASARVMQTGEKRATPATTLAGEALETVAKERATLNDLKRQEEFLRSSGKNKAKGRLTETFKALQAKIAAQTAAVKAAEAEQAAIVGAVRDVNAEERKAKAKPGYGGGLFRTSTQGGATLKTEQVERLAERITAGWTNAPDFVVVADESGLPDYIQAQAKADEKTGKIPGLYDPNTKTVYLVASSLHNANDVVLTIAHEAAGHFGLRSLLGAKLDAVMDALYAGNNTVRTQADAKMKAEPNLSKQVAVEEVLAEMAETGGTTPAEKSALRRIYDALKEWLRTTFNLPSVSDAEVQQLVADARRFVIEGGTAAKGATTGKALYRTAPAERTALTDLADKLTTKPKTIKEKLGNNLALQTEMQGVDMRAGLRDALKFGDDNLFTQAMYHVRKAEQKMAQMFTVMNNGPLESYKDEKGLIGYRSSNKNSAREVFEAISDIPLTDAQAKTNIAQAYLVAHRAANKGLAKLDLGALGVTQSDLDAAMAAADADPALKNALESVRRKYNAYNKGLIDFLASSGRISKKAAADLLKDGDYVPFYRVNDNGMAELDFGGGVSFTVGDIRRQPYLAELKGGETKLLPLNEAIQQNTLLLTDMALTNNATKSVAYGLQALGKGKGPIDPKTGNPSDLMAIHSGKGPDDPRIIRFFQEPDPNNAKDDGSRWVKVDTRGTAAEGVPAELVVQSLEGASLALPGFLKLGGVAADMLRSGVTRTPLYIARKLLREPMAAAFTGGLKSNAFSSVFKAGAEFLRMSAGTSTTQAELMQKGLIQSGIFSGDMSDMKKMALQLASGKDMPVWEKVFAAADRAALRADAATLSLVLKNAQANGLSEVEADMATMESMNFYKRGLSPTLQYASRLIPFFNAQVQSLNVLVKAARGQMPFEEQQEIQRKFFNNAMLLMATGLVYAMAMEDDETFRNARPRDKYSNFFLPIPGVAEPLKLPIPFEAGYFFSLAVAAVDGMRAETDGKAQWSALKDLFLGSIPGYSSMGVPQIVKPAFEVWSNKNFLTGAPVESMRLQGLSPEERYLTTTTDLAKALSKAVPILSPIQIEHLVRGYLGVMPLAAAAAANSLFEREGKGAAPEGRMSDVPLIGTAFQKKYGGADADVVFREAQETMQARTTLNKMVKEGRRDEALAYRDSHRAELMMAPAAGAYKQVVGRINEDVRRTQERADLSGAEKRVRLDALEKAKQDRADAYIKLLRQAERKAEAGKT